jgi:uncharacterized protein (DUF849 family)
MLQACLNGQRPRAEHPAVPVTPAQLAADAAQAVESGAAQLHVHPRVPGGGRDTVEPRAVAETLRAIRVACPRVPVGLTTGLWTTDGDTERRHALVESWDELPDYASVNLFEPGSAELCDLLARRGVGIEAGVWTLDDAHLLLERGLAPLRVLVETSDGGAEDPLAAAAEIDQLLVEEGVTAPQLHHGAGADAWEMLDAALARRHDVRIGLEDTTVMPDGSPARDNAALVAEAARRLRALGERPQ